MKFILSIILRHALPLLYIVQAIIYAVVGMTVHEAGLMPPSACYLALSAICLLIAICHWRSSRRN